MVEPLTLAHANGHPLALLPAMANRHGLITGATGTGKTVTLQVLAEGFSRLGVPVFLADVKGDLSGLGAAGAGSAKLDARLAQLGIPAPAFAASPALFWDLFAEQGHPVRATVSDMGPLLLARLLGLNDTQSGVLELVFKVADDEGLLLLDLKDLRAMVQFAGDNAKSLTTRYGNVSTASIGAILRNLLTLESAGGDHFFGEPMLDIQDLLQTDEAGHGHINVLAASKLTQSSRLYACFLLWLLSELFEQLPEVGIRTSRCWCSSSTRRTCCSTMPQGAAGEDRTGGAAHPLERGGRLLRDPEPGRHPRQRAGAAWQPGAARPARLYPE